MGSMYFSDGCLGRENRFYSIGVFAGEKEGEEEGEGEEEEGTWSGGGMGGYLMYTQPVFLSQRSI